MRVDNANLKAVIEVDVQKKAQDVVKNVLGDILEKTFENTKKVEEMAAKSTGKGMNLNIKA